ncbi:MAG: hypothetical protein EXR79_02295 [Myxococcales bacterium]|nr:hypothetical protein [Myxococcales bacterium]
MSVELPPGLAVLIVEDGDEYLDTLGRFVPGPRWLQARSARAALEVLARETIDLLYLDMRFDRSPRHDLVGDLVAAVARNGGDPERAWRHLALHQGLYILDALARAGHGHLPALLAYDFAREPRRFVFLRSTWPRLDWVSDGATAADIRAKMVAVLGRSVAP